MSIPDNDFVTTGHHTFGDYKPGDDAHAPYKRERPKEPGFLGYGYYFWEDNLPLAKWWGGKWYLDKTPREEYQIGETPITCNRNDFFDLVGRRDHQKYLIQARQSLARKRPGKYEWPIGKLIELLKGFNSDPESLFFGKFKYKVIRAVDVSFELPKEQKEAAMAETGFSGDYKSFTYLNPCYIICVVDKKGIILEPLKIVHKSRK